MVWVMSPDPARQVDPTDLDEDAGLHDDQAGVHSMARLTPSGREAEAGAHGEGSDEHVLEQSQGHVS